MDMKTNQETSHVAYLPVRGRGRETNHTFAEEGWLLTTTTTTTCIINLHSPQSSNLPTSDFSQHLCGVRICPSNDGDFISTPLWQRQTHIGITPVKPGRKVSLRREMMDAYKHSQLPCSEFYLHNFKSSMNSHSKTDKPSPVLLLVSDSRAIPVVR